MAILRILAAVTMTATVAWLAAGPALGEQIGTRYGTLERVANNPEDPYDDGIALDGVPVAGIAGRFEVEKIVKWGSTADVVLLSLWSGGAACCISYQIVDVRPQGARATDEFGMNAFEPKNFSVTDRGVSFELKPSSPPSVDHLVVTWDGAEIRISEVREDDSGARPAGPGPDVTRWIDRHPYEVLKEAGERNRFRAIMPEDELELFRQALSVGSTVFRDGGLVLGEGCWPHDCASRAAFFAIDIATGTPVAVLLFDGRTSTWGGLDGSIPAALARLVADYKRRVNY